MGNLFKNEVRYGDKVHVSTGKHPYPAGQYHDPIWGQTFHMDQGVYAQDCQYPKCDLFRVVKKGD